MAYEPEPPPDRLYKYQPFSAQVISALKSRTLWFGRPAGFNDPFDCSVPFRVAEVSDDDCLRLLNGKQGSDWDPLRSDRRYIDSEGRPTTAMKRELMESGERVLREKAAESYWNRGVTCFSERPDESLALGALRRKTQRAVLRV